MPQDLLTILPNLSIGVVSVVALAYVTLKHGIVQKDMQEQFVKALDGRADKHEEAMNNRERVIREVESHVRNVLQEQVMKNTLVMVDVTKMLERMSRHLDGEK